MREESLDPTLNYRQQLTLIRYQLHHEALANRGAGVRDLAITGVRSLVIIHGGALIGLFSFLGNTTNPALHISAQGVFIATGAFVLGLVTALLSIFFAYRHEGQQIAIALAEVEREAFEQPEVEPMTKTTVTAPSGVIALLSIALFVVGVLAAVSAVLGHA